MEGFVFACIMRGDLMSLAHKSVRWTFAGIYCAAFTACTTQTIGFEMPRASSK
jgi:hypothetical protein